jgi:hypothetical protein
MGGECAAELVVEFEKEEAVAMDDGVFNNTVGVAVAVTNKPGVSSFSMEEDDVSQLFGAVLEEREDLSSLLVAKLLCWSRLLMDRNERRWAIELL